MFVFESTVHSCNVLRRLDQLRRRDLLCDVTVVVEGRRYRAHRLVLASCGDFFTHRTQPDEVITLPREVTAAGFEPLLKFAYTSKLLFDSGSLPDIRNSASFLGFHDVEEACFDFLQPKLTCTGPAPSLKKSCKKNKWRPSGEDEAAKPGGASPVGKAVKPDADSSRQEVAPPSRPSEEHRGGETGLGQIPEKVLKQEAQDSGEDCELQISGHCSFSISGAGEMLAGPWRSELHQWEMQRWREVGSKGSRDGAEDGERLSEEPGAHEERSVQGERPSMHQCPLKNPVGLEEHHRPVVGQTPEEQTPEPPGEHQERQLDLRLCCREDGVEREVAEHLALQLGSDLQETDGCGGPRLRSCPFLVQEPRSCFWKASGVCEAEGASQSGVSSLTSGDEEDSEGESDACSRVRARQMQLPFALDWLVALSRNEFQQLLKQQLLTHEQQDFVHDMRRRSKNRLAAQRCRKRKLDGISSLQGEIQQLRSEREKLMAEKSQLSQMKLRTSLDVSDLCRRICQEAALTPEQVQVLARYSSPDCPLFAHTDALLSPSGATLQAALSGCRARTLAEVTAGVTAEDTGGPAETAHLSP